VTVPQFIESTAGEVAAELACRGISPDQHVTITIEPDDWLMEARRFARPKVTEAGLTDGRSRTQSRSSSGSVPRHGAADGADVGLGGVGLQGELAVEHDDDPIGKLKHLVEVLAHQQDRGTTVARLHDAVRQVRSLLGK
jgi:hypothetical protein